MSARRYIIEASRTSAMPSRSLARFDTCSCHPRGWGMKKGLRRARRRVSKELIRSELNARE
jgi:hypothetical protein